MPFKSDERNTQTEHIRVDRTISSTQGDSVRDGGSAKLGLEKFYCVLVSMWKHPDRIEKKAACSTYFSERSHR